MHLQQQMTPTQILFKVVNNLHPNFKIHADQLLNNFSFSVFLTRQLLAMLDKISALHKVMLLMEYAHFKDDFVSPAFKLGLK
jgi:hypothetical protein